MLFTVLVFNEKRVFLFCQLLPEFKDICLPYLDFFSAEKVKEIFHCDQPFFFSLQVSVRYYYLAGADWGVEGPSDLFLATNLFRKESNPHFCFAAGLCPLSDRE